jgi:hypothetical protein
VADNYDVTVIPVHSSDVRGITGGIMAVSTEADLLWFEQLMEQGLTKADALDRLTSRLALRAGAATKRGSEQR